MCAMSDIIVEADDKFTHTDGTHPVSAGDKYLQLPPVTTHMIIIDMITCIVRNVKIVTIFTREA